MVAARSWREKSFRGRPSFRTAPLAGARTPSSRRSRVDLPAPLGPMTAVTAASGNSADTPRSTARGPKENSRSRTVRPITPWYDWRRAPVRLAAQGGMHRAEARCYAVAMPTIALTGASGVVGRYLTRELLSRGHSVRGLVRSREKARAVLPQEGRLTLVQGDISDQGVAERLLE